MRIAIHASGRIWVRVREGDGVMDRVRVRVGDRVRVMERLVGVRVGRPIGKGIRIAIQASSSLLLPDPRMSAAKAALVRRGVGISVRGVRARVWDRVRIRVGVGVGVRVRVGVGIQVLVGVKVVEID